MQNEKMARRGGREKGVFPCFFMGLYRKGPDCGPGEEIEAGGDGGGKSFGA